MRDAKLRSKSELLKAFSHPTRLAILSELIVGPKCVSDMEELLPARQANISQHLSVLRNACLVDFAQDGILRCYYLCRPNLVRDLFSLIDRDEPTVTRTAEQINADKARLAKAMKRQSQATAKGTSKGNRRKKVVQ